MLLKQTKQVLFSLLHGVKALPSRPLLSWEPCVHQDLSDLGLSFSMQELQGMCAQRGVWRSMLYKLTHRDCGFAPASMLLLRLSNRQQGKPLLPPTGPVCGARVHARLGVVWCMVEIALIGLVLVCHLPH